jgi:hypothetical protein
VEAGARVAVRLARVLQERGDAKTASELLRRASERPDDVYAPAAARALSKLEATGAL